MEQDKFYWSLSGVIRYRAPKSTNNATSYGSEFEKSFQNIQSNRTPAGPNTGWDALVTISSAQYEGYDVTVDGIYVGTDGKGGDPLDGVYSLRVAGNLPHTIRVDHPWNWKSWSFWYFAGQSYVHDF